MANFAAAMMRAMSEINFEDMDIVENASDHFKLRGGISAGPVIAGKLTLNNGMYSLLLNRRRVYSLRQDKFWKLLIVVTR